MASGGPFYHLREAHRRFMALYSLSGSVEPLGVVAQISH